MQKEWENSKEVFAESVSVKRTAYMEIAQFSHTHTHKERERDTHICGRGGCLVAIVVGLV